MKMRNKWMGVLREYGWVWTYDLLVLMLVAMAAVPAMGESTGTTGAAFLKVPVGPRAAAMGAAFTAVPEGPYSLYYNPASISQREKWELSAMHQNQFAQIRFDYFGLTAPILKNRSAFGVSFIRMAVDDYARTELDDGAKFTNSDISLMGSYAHQIVKPLSVGVNAKLIKQTLAQYTANGWALDFGALLKINPRLSLGAAIQHIGPDITFIAIGDPLPTTFRVGGAFRLLPRGNLLATMDYWLPKDDADVFGFGVEYRPNRFVAFRGGYQVGTDFTGFDASSLGLSFNFENFGLEYAFVPREKLGDVHRAGINVTFGKSKPQVVAAQPQKPQRRRTTATYRPDASDVRSQAARPTRPTATSRRDGAAESAQVYAPSRPPRRRGDAAAPSYGAGRRPATEGSDGYETSDARTESGGVSDIISLRNRPAEQTPAPVTVQAPVRAAPRKTVAASPATVRSVPPPATAPARRVAPPAPSTSEDATPVYTPRARQTEEAALAPEAPPSTQRSALSSPRSALKPPPPAVTESPVVSQESKDRIAQEKLTLASNLMRDKRYEEAAAIARSGILEDPQNVPLWYLLSECLYSLERYDEAMEAVNKALGIIHGGTGK